MGGSVVGAVNLYYISCARVICGREHSWSGYIWAGVLLERLIYILYHVRELFVGGNEVGADIHGREYCWSGWSIFFYYVRDLYVGGNIVGADIHGREYCGSYILYHLCVGGNVARAVDLCFVSCARKLSVGGSVVGSVKYGRESCWSG